MWLFVASFEALSFAKLYYAKHSRWEQIDLAIGEELERLAVGEITPEQFTTTANERVDGVLSKSG